MKSKGFIEKRTRIESNEIKKIGKWIHPRIIVPQWVKNNRRGTKARSEK